jgi:hypothetical protein
MFLSLFSLIGLILLTFHHEETLKMMHPLFRLLQALPLVA